MPEPLDILAAIIEHGLSIRQIPQRVDHLMEMRHHKDGNDVVRRILPDMTPERFRWHKAQCEKYPGAAANYEFDEARLTVTRLFTHYTTTPNHAGWWMCQQVPGTSSRVEWRNSDCHLAPTLEESVRLFLDSRNPSTRLPG